jgi:exodeoxyribonuclease VII small subunit
MMAGKASNPSGDVLPVEQLSYEQALAELETIVAGLESGEQTLEVSMNLFERGQALAQYCAARLDQAELKVQQLTDGKLTDFTAG